MKKVLLVTLALLFAPPCIAPALANRCALEASWYSGKHFEGKPMTDGGTFRAANPTIAAHRHLPLGSVILVENLSNGRTLVMRVRDRGPFSRDAHGHLIRRRALDVSRSAAVLLGFKDAGTACVRITVLSLPRPAL